VNAPGAGVLAAIDDIRGAIYNPHAQRNPVREGEAVDTNDIQAPPVLTPPPPPNDKWQREQQAFLRLLPSLLQTHRDKYVAIHEGNVVESGDELVDVAMRAYGRYGYVPIYVDLVTDQPQRPVRIPSPRIVGNLPRS
jgi:hypothetical protein